jgi:hypothetical protein
MTIDINEYAEGAVILSDLDNAIIGIVEDFNGRRILYSKEKILNILIVRDGMSMDEAEEFYDYNILGLYAGEQNPVFIDVNITTIPMDGKISYYSEYMHVNI